MLRDKHFYSQRVSMASPIPRKVKKKKNSCNKNPTIYFSWVPDQQQIVETLQVPWKSNLNLPGEVQVA